MRNFTATEARSHFGEFLAKALSEPVRVIRRGKVAGVMVGYDDYEAMRVFYADRLRKTMNECAEGAAKAGLTEAKLAKLLADES